MCQGDGEVLSMETVVINVNLKVISVFVCLYYKSCKIPICTAENSSIKNDAMSLCVQWKTNYKHDPVYNVLWL